MLGLWLALLLGGHTAWAQGAVTLLNPSLASQFDLARATEILIDPSGQLDLAAVRSPAQAQQFQQRNARLGFTAAAVWLRLRLHNPSAEPQSWWFDTGNRTLQELDLYSIDAQGQVRHQSASSTWPFARRPLPVPNFVFALDLPAQQTVQLYLRVRSTGYLGVDVRPRIATPAVILAAAQSEKTQWLVYGGMVAALMLVNMALGLYLRDRAYGWYAASVLAWSCAVTSASGGYGAAYELLWPDSPLFEQVSWVASTLVATTTVVYFICLLLDLRQVAPRATRWLWRATAGFAVLVTLQIGGTLLQRADLARPLQVLYLLGGILYVAMTILLWSGAITAARAGKRLAWYVMLANVPNTIYPTTLTALAVIEGHAPVFGGPFMWTSLFELFVMAFALGDRFYLARVELLTTRALLALHQDKIALVERLREETNKAQLAQREAVQANLAKSKFLAAASHDLRQPMHALGLFLEVLSSSGLSASQHLVLGKARSVFGSSSEMLNTLLDFSRIEAGVVEMQPVVFALQPLLNKIEIEMAPQADAQGLIYRTREAHGAVLSDPALVELILRNLVSNAIRYTRQGGVLVGWRSRGASTRIEVWDTGIGIAPEQQQEVFEEFHQLGNAARDRNKGLGLGLAIAQGLARQIGSHVTLASRPGRGSVFRFDVPMTPMGVQRDAPMPSSGPIRLPGLQILFIDDDAAVRAAMAQLLGSWGCHCQVAESITEAVRAARVQRPEVIISDWRLQHDDTGAQAIAAVRSVVGQAVLALLITGDTAPERLRQALASGIALLHKPVLPSQLHQRLIEVLGRR